MEHLALLGVTALNGTGNELNNRLEGNAAANVLTGGAGSDEMIGGAGDDTYVFGPGDGLDTVVDTDGYDVIRLAAGIGPEDIAVDIDASGAHLRIFDLAGEKTGEGIDINLAADGTPAIEAIEFADGTVADISDFSARTVYGTRHRDVIRTGNTSDTIYALSGWDTVYAGGNDDTVYGDRGTDWIYGEAGNDVLYGGHGTDWLYGGSGADVLDGGNGVDFLIGGTGNDVYIADNRWEIVIELANEGIDTVLSDTTYTLGWNLENLTLTGNRSIDGTGNSQDNTLIGNSRNNDLDGGAGDDVLDGGAGTGSSLRFLRR